MEIRIVTINVAGLEHGWFEQRSSALIGGLKELAPDILCLQEAVIESHPRFYHQLLHIAEALGFANSGFASYGKSAEVITPQIGGVAIASRWPLSYAESRRLPSGTERPWEHRIALLATLATPSGSINVATTHLSWEPDQVEMRTLQMNILLDYLGAFGWLNPHASTLVAGDFNAESEEPAIKLISQKLRDSYQSLHPHSEGWTWTGANPYSLGFRHLPDRRIDYVFCSPQAEILEAKRVLDLPCPVFPSDHFGVLVDLVFPRER